MADEPDGSPTDQPIAIVGLACRFPDADDPPALLDLVLTGRRAFRRLPPCRLDLADYYSADPATPDATYSTRAALIEGWQFDKASFGVSASAYEAADPAHWLALETVARALAAAGFPGGKGLARDRVGVMIGNTLAGDISRAVALRLRWPYVRRVLADAMAVAGVPGQQEARVARTAAAQYLAPFPEVTAGTLAGSRPASIAAGICGYFGFRGGGYAVDGASSSSLLAVTSACSALAAGDLDVALAGGVDVSLDPFELVGLAKAGLLAAGDVRVYDESPTGFLPGEGCGVVVLMRSADARAARLPLYAEIAGWGMSSAGHSILGAPDPGSQLLALRRAYQRAGIDPVDVQLIEGDGAGTAAGDLAELTALTELRKGARQAAALGSITANIGHAKAAAGAAGLIKTVLAMGSDVMPPATGVSSPHRLLQGKDAALRLMGEPAPWPAGRRIAGVSAMDPGGANVHVVLSSEPAPGSRYDRVRRARPRGPRAVRTARADSWPAATSTTVQRPAARTFTYLLQAPGRASLAVGLAKIAETAPYLSDAELHDLACQLARQAGDRGPARVAIVASRQAQLAGLAHEAIMLLPDLTVGQLVTRPGIFVADGAASRVTLLLPGGDPGSAQPGRRPADDAAGQSAALAWLDRLGVQAAAAVGRGLGEIAGLGWAGCLPEEQATRLASRCGDILADPSDPGGQQEERSAQLRALLHQFTFTGPRHRLFSAATGRALATVSDIVEAICAQLSSQDRLDEALSAGAADADLLIETGPGQSLSAAAARCCQVPVISLAPGAGIGSGAGAGTGTGTRTGHAAWHAAAALFAVGALGSPQALYAGEPARTINIWRERIFIASPCEVPPSEPAGTPIAGAAPSESEVSQADQDECRADPEAPQAGHDEGHAKPEARLADHSEGPAKSEAPPAGHGQPEARLADSGTGLGDSAVSRIEIAGGPQSAADHPDPARADPPLPAGASRPAAEPPPGASRPAGTPPSAGDQAASDGDPVTGIGPWTRCFAEQLQPPRHYVSAGDDRPWRVTVATNHPLSRLADELFPDEPGAGRTLAILGDPDDSEASAAALASAGDALSTGQLVVISDGPGFTGFFASLHAEYPSLGITLLRVPKGADGLRAARRYAATTPGQFRELWIDSAGLPFEPVMVPADVAGGEVFPLGTADVVLISRGTAGAGLALAQVLACCGAAVAVIGRDGPDEDSAAVHGLERLRSAGVRVAFEVTDVADPAGLAAAVQRIERELGPVTAVGHAAAAGRTRLVSELTDTEFRAHAAAGTAGLRNLVSSIKTDRLRLIATFGSVVGRYGMAGESLLALASGSLAAAAQRMSDTIPGCRAMHVDWPGWSGTGLGERADLAAGLARARIAAIGVEEGSRLLLKMLATPELPARVAVHGRVGVPAPAAIADGSPQLPLAAGAPGRFLEILRVHYPGIELVSEARLSLRADPYLTEHQVDGIPVLPAAMALEAMAQAASALAGRPVRRATGVSMIAPVVVPPGQPDGEAVIRICALRDGNTIRTAVRCAESGFVVDHFVAAFCCQEDEPRAAELLAGAGGADLNEMTAAQAASAGIVDGGDLYGPICFQSGRFRRVAFVPEVSSRGCRALLQGADDQPWFGSAGDLASAPLILGSPGLNDATVHVLQACVPHRRLFAAGCDSVTFSGRETDGVVEITAVARPAAARAEAWAEAPTAWAEAPSAWAEAPSAWAEGRAEAPAEAWAEASVRNAPPPYRRSVPQPRSAGRPAAQASARPEEYAWDVEAVDAAGRLLVSWRGLRLRDAGLLPRTSAWPLPLLSVYLERNAAALGLDDHVRVSVRCAQPDSGPGPVPADPAGWSQLAGHADASPYGPADASPYGPANASPDGPANASPQGSADGPADRGSPGSAQPASSSRAYASAGSGCLAGFELRMEAGDSPVCSWHAADPAQAGPPADPRLAGLRTELARRFSEPLATLNARLRAIAACLPPPDPLASHIVIDRIAREDWLLLQAGGAVIACTVAELRGVPLPVAIAMATGGSGNVAGPLAGQGQWPATWDHWRGTPAAGVGTR